jgi:3-hydroxybutyrate dehydrogenase
MKEEVDKQAEGLRNEGYDVHGVECDVRKEADIQATLHVVIEKHGRLDVLINNAGMQHVAPIEEFPTEKFELLTKIMQQHHLQRLSIFFV